MPRSQPCDSGAPAENIDIDERLPEWNGLSLLLNPMRLEDVWCYGPGGHHPVHLGDQLGADGRFRVLHKLGHGGFANVWLCRDLQAETTKYVAIKILMADGPKDECPELQASQRLQEVDIASEPGGRYICLPLEHFQIEGPNGTHICLVYPVLGPSVAHVAKEFDDPDSTLRGMCTQVVQALSSLHAHGLCHGDLNPSNILLRTTGFDGLSEDELMRELGEPVKNPVQTESGEPPAVLTAPKYLVYPLKFNEINPRFVTDQVCVIDFGESFSAEKPPKDLGITQAYRSPELILEKLAGKPSDIWALGCTLFEVRTGRKLFDPWDNEVDEHLHQMVMLLGPLPEPWWSETWEFRREILEDLPDSTGRAVRTSNVDQCADDDYRSLEDEVAMGHYYEHYFRRDIPENEIDEFADLLERIFKYNPNDRLTASEIQDHSWFKL